MQSEGPCKGGYRRLLMFDENGSLKILGIWPQPTADEAAAIAGALHELYGAVALVRPSKWIRSGRMYSTDSRADGSSKFFATTKWLAAARTEALR